MTGLVSAPSLRYWRYTRFVTRGELARIAHVDWHTIQSLEAGGTARSLDSIERLAVALRVKAPTLQRRLSDRQRQTVAREAALWAHDEHPKRLR